MKAIVARIFPLLFFGYCQTQTTFRNPILDENFDFTSPSVYKHQCYYYMTLSNGTAVEVLKSPILSNFRNAERREIYRAPSGWANLGSPRMHYIQGGLYIYFHMVAQHSLEGARMFVIRSLDPCNPLGSWSEQTGLLPEIQGHKQTVLQNNNGDLYLIWTGTIPDGAWYNLFIARMETPTKVIGPGMLLRYPTMDWERHGRGGNESPTILRSHGAIFLTFSASNSNNENYCLGIMGMDGGGDPTMLANWWDDASHCVFGRSDVERVFGTGHASFVTSPDASETWIAYQAWNSSSFSKTVRIQRLEWGEMNRPKFPLAMGLQSEFQVPSGE